MPTTPDHDRFSLPGEIPDATDPCWRTPESDQDDEEPYGVPSADWRARGLKHPAGRGWEPDTAPWPDEGGATPRGMPKRVSPWPRGWWPGDPPMDYGDLTVDPAGDLWGDPDEPNAFAPPRARLAVFDAPARVRFLDCLASCGEVLASAARVGVSRETVYRARRRYPDFARLWDAALVHARAAAEAELATRAMDGVRVPVIVRGEIVATWRRHDPRYLLAHLARLDRRIAEDAEAVARAEHFDVLLAAHAGHEPPEDFAEAALNWAERDAPAWTAELPPGRETYAAYASACALHRFEAACAAAGDVEPEEDEAAEAEIAAAGEAHENAYDAWREGGLALVDAIVEGGEGPPDSSPSKLGEGDHSRPERRRRRRGRAEPGGGAIPPDLGKDPSTAIDGPPPAAASGEDSDLPYEIKSLAGSVSHLSTPLPFIAAQPRSIGFAGNPAARRPFFDRQGPVGIARPGPGGKGRRRTAVPGRGPHPYGGPLFPFGGLAIAGGMARAALLPRLPAWLILSPTHREGSP